MSDIFSINDRQRTILEFSKSTLWFSVSEVATAFQTTVPPATIRRDLGELVEHRILERQGENKGVRYRATIQSMLFMPYELSAYYSRDETTRQVQESYNFDIFPAIKNTQLINDSEIAMLESATEQFQKNAEGMSPQLHKKELERFVIEFSWKSSKIEGNTYSLLDTEFLLQNGIEAQGKSKFETKMILNHKQAYLFIVEATRNNTPIDIAFVERLHYLLMRGLGVEHGLRNRPVGISGSTYKPLAIKQQIQEQLNVLMETIKAQNNPYTQALTALLGLSYLQPFEDGNKRTARIP